MVFIFVFLINPLLGNIVFHSGMNTLQFSLLVLSTLLITAGGYLINDFFDMQPDNINKPGINQVGKYFPVARIQLLYWIFTLSGVLIGALLSWMVNRLSYSLIFVFAAGLLWFYSERYQCMPVIGNMVVAFLSALSFGLVWIYEFFALSNNSDAFAFSQANFPIVHHMVLMYMGFAFITSLLREIVKDIEDQKGDERYGCNTFAVVYGQNKSKVFGTIISVGGLLFSIWFQKFFFTAGFYLLLGYFIVVDIIFLGIVYWLIISNTKTDFKRLSSMVKLLMIIGVLSMVLIYFEV